MNSTGSHVSLLRLQAAIPARQKRAGWRRLSAAAVLAVFAAGMCTAQPAQSVVTFNTDVDCTWKLDGKVQSPLAVGEKRSVSACARWEELRRDDAIGHGQMIPCSQ